MTESFSVAMPPQDPNRSGKKKSTSQAAMQKMHKRAMTKEVSPHNDDYFDNIKQRIEGLKKRDDSRKGSRKVLGGAFSTSRQHDQQPLSVMNLNSEYGLPRDQTISVGDRKLNLTQQMGTSFFGYPRNSQFDGTSISNFSGAELKSKLTNTRIGGLARRQIARQFTHEQDEVNSMFRNKFDIGKNTAASFFQKQQRNAHGGPQVPLNINKNFNDIIMSQENLKQHIIDQFEKKEVDQIRNIQEQEQELDLLRSQREQMSLIQDQLRSHIKDLMTIKKRKIEDDRQARKEMTIKESNANDRTPVSGRGVLSSVDSKRSPSTMVKNQSPLGDRRAIQNDQILKQKNQMLQKIEDALRRSFERKQAQITANLEQITAIEKELSEAKQINKDQKKEIEKEIMRATGSKKKMKKPKYRRDADGGVATQTQTKWPKEEGRSSSGAEHSSSRTSQSNSQLAKVQGREEEARRRVHPAKQGMAHASQQLSQGNYQVENPHNKLGPKLMETLKDVHVGMALHGQPQFVDQALDPMVRDQANDCMVRDMATDPLANEKGTDPKMKDTATDAWKRDGFMQTLKKSHQGSLQIAQEKVIIPTIEKEKIRKKEEEMAKAEAARKKEEKLESPMHSNKLKDMITPHKSSSKKKKSKARSNSPHKHGGTQYDLNEMAHGKKGVKDQKNNSSVMSGEEEDQEDNSFDRSNVELARKLQELPIYHDHLVDDILNQKLNKLNSSNNPSKFFSNKRSSDSRSTQQAFDSSLLGYKLNQNRLKDHRLTIQPTLQPNPNQSNVKIQDSHQQQNFVGTGGNQQFQSPGQQNLPPIGSEFLTPKMNQMNQYSGQQNLIGSPANTVVRNQNSLLYPNDPAGAVNDPKLRAARRFNLDQQAVHQNMGGQAPGFMNAPGGMNGPQQMVGQNRGQQSLPPVANPNFAGQQQNFQQNPQMYFNQGQNPYAGGGGMNQVRGSHSQVNDSGMYMGQGNQLQASMGQFNSGNQVNLSIQRASLNGPADQPNQPQQPLYNMQMLNSSRDPNNSQERMMGRGGGLVGDNTMINQSIQHLPRIGGGPATNSFNQSQQQSNAMLGQMQHSPGAPGGNYIDLNQESYKGVGGNLGTDRKKPSHPLKYFKGQDLEMYYMEKQLKPEVERELKKGFFEIRKKFKFDGTAENGKRKGEDKEEEVQVYVSHVSLHDFHPIFCKFAMDSVKTILNYSSIVYLNQGQTLYAPGFNDTFFYIILFGKLNLFNVESKMQIGQQLTIGWTVGEEILFKPEKDENGQLTAKQIRREICKAGVDSCVLGIDRKNLIQIKRNLFEKNREDEFAKFEIVLRGNHLVKKDWK